MAGASHGARPPDDDEVDDPWGVSSVVHLRAGGTSLLLDAGAPGLPAVLHWGGDLGELTVDETDALAAALAPGRDVPRGAGPGGRRAAAGPSVGVPLLAPGRAGTAGPDLWVADGGTTDGGDDLVPDGGPGAPPGAPPGGLGVPGVPASSGAATTAAPAGRAAASVPAVAPGRTAVRRPAPAAVLVRVGGGLAVTRSGHQRLSARAADVALGLAVEVVLDLSPTGVLRLRAVATCVDAAPVQVAGLHLALPVPPAGRQVLLDVGGRLRPASTRRPAPPAPGVPVRPSELVGAVVLATAGSTAEELWALAATTASRRSSARRPEDPLVRVLPLAGGGHLLAGGEDVPAAAGATTWTTPVLLAAHGRSWGDVRARLSVAARDDGGGR